MRPITVEIPLSRARLCVNCENIFDATATSTFACPVCAGKHTASVEGWLNRTTPLGLVKQAA